MLNSIG